VCRVSVIIPHYNGRAHLPDCLAALSAQTYRDFETILVDNGSTDGSQAWVRTHYPSVTLVELGRNTGFTGACNAGYAAAKGDIVILLNNDTQAVPGWLEAVVDAFERHPEAGCVASKLLLFDRRDHLHAAGDYVRLDGIPGNRGVWERDEGQFEREEYVFSACGAAAAYRRTMIEEVGFLDDSFFFSCEDVDLGWRAQLAGWRTLYVPDAVVYHKLKATGGSVMGSFYDGRNYIFLLAKNYPRTLWRRFGRRVIRAQWRITREALTHWRGAAARARLRGQLAGLLGLPRMLRKRRAVQRMRRVPDAYLTAIMTPIDGNAQHGMIPDLGHGP
jgi:GT2 family glycosyltransferase